MYSLLKKAKEKSWDLSSALAGGSEDPFALVEGDMETMNRGLLETVSNSHALLDVVAKYYFQMPGKRFRPTVVLLMGSALQGARATQRHVQLAEIVEMIHTASLAHDDVLDEVREVKSM